ncbi:MAG: glutaredoxin 3 [Burkholderiales bacterium]|jgi:glutaredoxin 3
MPEDVTPPEVVMYCTAMCPYCLMADRLLERKGVGAVNRIRVDMEPGRRREMTERTGRTSVPQIFIGELHVGGYSELSWLDQAGRLDLLLEGVFNAGGEAGIQTERSQ